MKITEVNFTDLMGKRYNGYDLHNALKEKGHEASQIVKHKKSDSETVYSVNDDFVIDNLLLFTEKKLSLQDMLFADGRKMLDMPCYQEADLVHYHISYNNMVSLLDMPELVERKRSVWTFHDLWPITGRCIHPLSCDNWRYGCGTCERIKETPFDMSFDNAGEMWKIKKDIFSKLDMDVIVPSEYMKRFVLTSPITSHLEHIHTINFGINVDSFHLNKTEIRMKNNISEHKFVIGFRADDNPIKGCRYIYNILRNMKDKQDIILATVGGGTLPEDIKKQFRIIDYGWLNDEKVLAEFYQLCDIFLMPSEAESFGLMAIEAMASGVPVVCFQGTVVEELINAPEIGIAVEYKSEKALHMAIRYLIDNKDDLFQRAKLSEKIVSEKYRFDQYVDNHIKVYEEILGRSRS